jgi:hypothetical protein
MGEYLKRDSSDPSFVSDSRGAGSDVGKMLQAVALAQQLGKSVDEVLAFMGTTSNVAVPATPAQTVVPQLPVELPPALQDVKLSLPTEEVPTDTVFEAPISAKAKVVALKEVPADGFVVTETVELKDATEQELDQAFPDEDENNWDGKIREGSKIKVTYNVPGSRIKWAGKIGKVIRVIGNEQAKVYEVEFKGQKIAKVRINKKTGKLERGYENKKLCTTFDQEDIELYS